MTSDITTIKNPFNTASFASKIPDGKTSYSIGVKRQVSKQVVSKKGAIVFALTPTFNTGGFNLDISNANVVTDIQYHTFNDSDINISAPTSAALGGVEATPVAVELKLGTNAPEKWRLVSAGMKITLTNNSEKNDGWFEAIRVNCSPSSKDFVYLRNTGALDGVIGVHPNFEDQLVSKASTWVNHPSYITGKLRDLHKHMFILQSVNGSRDFNPVRQSNNTNGFVEPSIPAGSFSNDPKESWTFKHSEEIEHWVDDSSFDIVLVKCYSSADATTATSATNLHMHMVHNHEYIYDSLSNYSKFQTPTKNYSSSVARAISLINSDSKPSIPFDSAPGQVNTCIQACKKTVNKSSRGISKKTKRVYSLTKKRCAVRKRVASCGCTPVRATKKRRVTP